MWLISSDAAQSSCGVPHAARARLIFTVKWGIWFTSRRPAASSHSTSEELCLQNRPKLHHLFFFFLPLVCAPLSCANLSVMADNTSFLWSLNQRIIWIREDNGHTCLGLTSNFHHFHLLTCTHKRKNHSVCARVCVCDEQSWSIFSQSWLSAVLWHVSCPHARTHACVQWAG